MYLDTVASETSKPSFSSSPWTRGAPHPVFSVTIRRTSALNSTETRGLPGRRGLDFHRQYSRKPRRCQRTTVSGRTIASASRQPLQVRRKST